MDHHGTTALVTGASSGIGERFATELAARGAALVLVARRQDRLEALAGQLRTRYGVPVTALPADLSTPAPGAALRDTLREQGITVTMLVNNAGFAVGGHVLDLDPAAVQRQLAVNVAALTDLTHAFLPDLVAAPDGVLVNVASMAGTMPFPGLAAYSASKTYVLSFTAALAHKLRAEPIRVLTLVPGATRSEFWSTAGLKENGPSFGTPEEVVETALRALDRRRTPLRAVAGRGNRIAFRISRWPMPPRLQLRLAANLQARSL